MTSPVEVRFTEGSEVTIVVLIFSLTEISVGTICVSGGSNHGCGSECINVNGMVCGQGRPNAC